MSFFKVMNFTRKHEVLSYWECLPSAEEMKKIMFDYDWLKTDVIVSTDYVDCSFKFIDGIWIVYNSPVSVLNDIEENWRESWWRKTPKAPFVSSLRWDLGSEQIVLNFS